MPGFRPESQLANSAKVFHGNRAIADLQNCTCIK